jgi:hypothetical protein
MVQLSEGRDSEYRRLRADYDAAYAILCAEERGLRDVPEQRRFVDALALYRERRDRLARFLVSSGPAARAAAFNARAVLRPSSTC